MRKVTKIENTLAPPPKRGRVAAYARVSLEKETALHSLAAQVDKYTTLITSEPEWEFTGVYADEPISGTKSVRPEFQRMIEDGKQGKFDMVITKSVKRFARNTVILLETIRTLKAHGVDVYFELENIHTISAEGELLITILASYAQEESRSNSENQLWKIRKNFEEGNYNNFNTYGYDKKLNVIPHEAEMVQKVFALCLEGNGSVIISRLTGLGKKRIRYMLSNERYVGDLLLQKYYTLDHLSKKKMTNNGEKEQYFITDNHTPIIDRATFAKAQEILKARAEQFKGKPMPPSDLKGKIICGCCGRNLLRKKGYKKPYWICRAKTENYYSCPSKQIREDILLDLIEGDSATVYIDYIITGGVKKAWENKSRSLSWTDEMKKEAGIHAKMHNSHTG